MITAKQDFPDIFFGMFSTINLLATPVPDEQLAVIVVKNRR